jgi:nucleoside phosphorylase
LTPDQFLSSEPTSRIEPAEFLAHVLPQYGAEASDVKVRAAVLLTFIPALQRRLLRHLDMPPPQPQPIVRQAWHNPDNRSFSTLSSPVGAPMAVMLLEQLFALGARRFLYLGFCGALDPTLSIGDLLIPVRAVREEGTSYHYLPAGVEPEAAPSITALLQHEAERQRLDVRQGLLWTTDAPFRETPAKIAAFQAAGVRAVDMEISALLSVAVFRGCEVGALLVVSDECYHPAWRPGFGAPEMRRGCREAVALGIAVADLLGA